MILINAVILNAYATHWKIHSGIKNNLICEADMKILPIDEISLKLIDTASKELLPLIVAPNTFIYLTWKQQDRSLPEKKLLDKLINDLVW